MKRHLFAFAGVLTVVMGGSAYAAPSLDLPQVSGKPVVEQQPVLPLDKAIQLDSPASRDATSQLPVKELDRANTLTNQNQSQGIQVPSEFEAQYNKSAANADAKTTGAPKEATKAGEPAGGAGKTDTKKKKNSAKDKENYNQ